ncbi:MAG: type III pantothenate kinase [Alphaproteobacteria bacterium]|jgi:type III pantothenate kinase|nr:type III pantothenate kinase [Alphaproteobacteria bacterium]MDG1412769.1 type III pantothenate kinase [Alphaproteobacteria bacterium]HAD73216.1 type III pantothenate kinase [Alphaproteobacteria bacterium]|tara:strand:- start:1048 stop:1851 length:804 start_codon:yes stop_codon:yes gene_type:complete
MLLAVDCGNTNIVMSVFDDEAICCQWRLETKGPHSGKAYLDVLTQQLTKISCSPQDIDGCVIASVVPDITPHLSSFATNILGVVPVIVGAPGVTLALEIDIDNPAEVGADRLVNAVAVAHLGLVPAIVVDFGTATTFDIVRTAQTDKHKACYAGGVISPGVHRSSEALAMAAAQLPQISVDQFDAQLPVLGTSTVSAMRSGVLWGYVGLVEGILARLEAEAGYGFTKIATGGLASVFVPHLPMITSMQPDLTVIGLKLIYDMNNPKV